MENQYYFERLMDNDDFQQFLKDTLSDYRNAVERFSNADQENFQERRGYLIAIQEVFFSKLRGVSTENKKKRLKKLLSLAFSSSKLEALLDSYMENNAL